MCIRDSYYIFGKMQEGKKLIRDEDANPLTEYMVENQAETALTKKIKNLVTNFLKRMKTRIIYKSFLAFLLLGSIGCSIPILKTPTITNSSIPSIYTRSTDSIGITKIIWKDYFSDSNLSNLINTALKNNQELNIITQEIEISKNEVMARTGEYLSLSLIHI